MPPFTSVTIIFWAPYHTVLRNQDVGVGLKEYGLLVWCLASKIKDSRCCIVAYPLSMT